MDALALVEVVGVISAIYTHAGAALLAGALALGAAWQVQDWRMGGQLTSLKASHAAAAEKAQTDARAAQLTVDTTYQEALNAARIREISLRRERDAARAESDGLREQSAAAARRLADAPHATVLDYATTAGELLADCSRGYQELAGQADGHAADVRALTEAWPRNRPSFDDTR